MGEEADFSFIAESNFITISSADNPLTLRIYDIDGGGLVPHLRASFVLPPHSNDAFHHWLYIGPNRPEKIGPFYADNKKSILVLELGGINVFQDKTYTFVFQFRALMELSGLWPASECPPSEGLAHVSYAWEDWGPQHTRLFAWEPTGRQGPGSGFASQYARGIPSGNGTYDLLVLDFDPIASKLRSDRYPLVPYVNLSRLLSTTRSPCSGQLNGVGTIGGDGLFVGGVSTSLPFAFDIVRCDLASPSLKLDHEHLVVTQVCLLFLIRRAFPDSQ